MVTRAKNGRWRELVKDNIPLERLAQHYEAHNRSDGKSPRTVEWYSRVIGYFAEYLRSEGYAAQLGDVDIGVVREFILYLQSKTRWSNNPYMKSPTGSLKAISIQNYIRGLRAFCSWLHRERYTDENMLADLKPPRVPHKLTEVLTESEVRLILSCLDPATPTGCRDTAIVTLFLDTGLRLSELTSLRTADAYIEQCYVKIMGKGAKERIVPIGVTAQKVLQRYVFRFRPEPLRPDEENLFLTLEGRPLTSNAVRLILSRLSEKSGVKRLHAHLCRHTFATNYLTNGGDVFSLQQILGHTSLEMVKRYVTLASSQVRIQHKKFSPMDRMDLGRLRSGGLTRKGPSSGSRPAKRRNAVRNTS